MKNIIHNTITKIMVMALTLSLSSSGVAAEYNIDPNDPNFETWYVNVSLLNCRTEPSDQSEIQTVYDDGTKLTIIGCDGGNWWQVYDGERVGWVWGDYLRNTEEKPQPTHGKYLGRFLCTGYTPSPGENGGYAVTALGDNLWNSVGWAIATDPRVIPLNTRVYIEGIGYRTARDTGGAIKGNHIDVLVSSNSQSLALTGYYNVYLAE